jgi:hypothetical protein
MIFVPYEEFKNIEFIGEGGFSKIYKATWINCLISNKGTQIIPYEISLEQLLLKSLTILKILLLKS